MSAIGRNRRHTHRDTIPGPRLLDMSNRCGLDILGGRKGPSGPPYTPGWYTVPSVRERANESLQNGEIIKNT